MKFLDRFFVKATHDVDNIFASFIKYANQLEAAIEHHKAMAETARAQAKQLIVNAQKSADEAERAARGVAKIKDLIS